MANATTRYQARVRAAFPHPSPAMAAYIAGFAHRETDAELDAHQERWEHLTEDEQRTCRELAETT